MDNMNPPPGGFRDWPTEQMGPKGGQDQAEPDRPGGPGRPCRQAGAGGTQRRVRLGVAVAAGAVLLCGGAAAGAALTGGTSPASAGPTAQAALLNTMLSSASSSTSAATAFATTAPAGSPAAAHCRTAERRLRAAGRPRAVQAVRRACRRHLLRLRVLAGIHGQFTFETTTGPRTLAFERGIVQSVSPTAVVVRAQDGTTWTWNLVSSTVVRQHARRVAASALSAAGALSAGQHVFVGGPVTGHANDARLIVIRASGRAATSP
jgi:hypothetical protein